MGKGDNKSIFVCNSCGEEFPTWMGRCSNCSKWGTLEESEVRQKSDRISSILGKDKVSIVSLDKIVKQKLDRYSSGFVEFDRVLGGSSGALGFVKSQVLLLSGDPGIGKSTILLQILFNLVAQGMGALYISGEESESQIAIRADRIVSRDKSNISKRIKLVSAFSVEDIISILKNSKYEFVILDSIQTVYSEESSSLPGSIAQVKLCAHRLISFAKEKGIILIIVGHINKDGNVAGPKVLEHLVDTVFQLEGEEKTGLRVLRSLKNRFGDTREVGIFQMEDRGMIDVVDPTKIFQSEISDKLIGVCRSVIVEGSRPFIVEVQALVGKTAFSLPKRVAEGVPLAKIHRISAILGRYTKLRLDEFDIYVKIGGGLKIDDPGIDLAIAVAIISSIKSKAVLSSSVVFGELHLTGRVGRVSRLGDRLKEATRQGYSNVKSYKELGSVSKISKELF